ncbi:hypothetical protein [Mycobacterium tuberculosis]|uniref:hypothetical protein n=1 Tax=Mycobacterium tuberculosis TaxID=1773 RepID=UPI00272AA515|nr:hypothetical protein [Mycobacterium tuberculosis]
MEGVWKRDLFEFAPELRKKAAQSAMADIPPDIAIDEGWKLLSNERPVRFKEMEYHLPIAERDLFEFAPELRKKAAQSAMADIPPDIAIDEGWNSSPGDQDRTNGPCPRGSPPHPDHWVYVRLSLRSIDDEAPRRFRCFQARI